MDTDDNLTIATGSSSSRQCVPRSNSNQVRIPQYEKELKDASEFAETRRVEVEKLSSNFKKKGGLRRFWDAKVPEKDWTFYKFFKFGVTDPEEVSRAMGKYVDFYDEMGTLVTKICTSEENNENDEESNETEDVVYHSLVLDLGKMANDLFVKAVKGKANTNSTEICNLHSLFLKKHDQLEKMLKDTENTALKRDLTRATKGWMESKKEINKLTKKVNTLEEKMNALIEKFDKFTPP